LQNDNPAANRFLYSRQTFSPARALRLVPAFKLKTSNFPGHRDWRSDLHFVSGMALGENLALCSLANLDVNCCCDDGTVAEEALDVPQVHPVFQE
jgi:hypothetical protein